MDIGDSDDKKAIDIKLEPCCKKCNNTKISIMPEAGSSTRNTPEFFNHQDGSSDETNIKPDDIIQSDNHAQNIINGIKINHEIDSNSDIEVDFAYRIIDTFNVCEVKTFKREGENTKTLLKIDQTQIKVEVGNQIDLDYHNNMTNNVNVCDKEKNVMRKENVDYDNLNSEDDMNKQHFPQLQIKGM